MHAVTACGKLRSTPDRDFLFRMHDNSHNTSSAAHTFVPLELCCTEVRDVIMGMTQHGSVPCDGYSVFHKKHGRAYLSFSVCAELHA